MERRLRDVAFDKLGASVDLTRCIVAADVMNAFAGTLAQAIP